ncbi:leucine-rich repeat extensin-like protein 7 [Ananas comosus]|uniref:Leucine-rich repeat extensin-like protein 7 n=1 Tax=Ananas comosus TaxID=4615 RepID=A0A6P5GTZ1_ANACO|nr:leucine-rich repeat extensin-like protein 7 [Ananas comosus]
MGRQRMVAPCGGRDCAVVELATRADGLQDGALTGLALLHELDLSNNRFVGAFPGVILDLPALRYLDLRFNEFEGPIPAALFNRPLDAIFLNSNRLRRPIPANLGDSSASVVVLAHNQLGGCIPPSIGCMADTLNEIVLLDDGLAACVPPEVDLLRHLTVFDVSFNLLRGPLPSSLSGAADLQQLDVAHKRLTGAVPEAVCALPSSLLLRPLSSSRMRRMSEKTKMAKGKMVILSHCLL